jgi:hypothetical protein
MAMSSMCLKVGGTHSAHDKPHVSVAGHLAMDFVVKWVAYVALSGVFR